MQTSAQKLTCLLTNLYKCIDMSIQNYLPTNVYKGRIQQHEYTHLQRGRMHWYGTYAEIYRIMHTHTQAPERRRADNEERWTDRQLHKSTPICRNMPIFATIRKMNELRGLGGVRWTGIFSHTRHNNPFVERSLHTVGCRLSAVGWPCQLILVVSE